MKYFIKNKKYLLIAAVGFMIAGVSSCKKNFLDVGLSNPNSVTDQNITPELIFPNAAVRTAARTASGNFTFLENWMGYFSTAGDYAIDQEETTYNIDFTFGQALWDNHYDVLFDLFQTKNLALAKGDSVLAGVSMVLSAKLWQELVDLYGNIPFTDAFHIERTSTPAYDKDSTVYRLLQGQLDQAIGYMQTGVAKSTYSTVVSSVLHFGTGATGGSFVSQRANWIQMANTLKLRMLIRTSEVTTSGVDRNAELAKITANGGVLGAGQTLNCNPGYSDQTSKQMPFYANYGFTPTGTDANAIARANKYTVDSLSARNDARLVRLYRGVGGTPTAQGGAVVGTRYGLATGNPFGNASSKMGFGTATSATRDQWIFTSVESLFLLAEAVQRGWIAGTPATAYQNAVNESFRFLGVPGPVLGSSSPDSTAISYTTNNSTANFAYANSAVGTTGFTFTPVKFIAYQKYIAMNSIDPLEGYSDLRRLKMIPDMGYLSVNPQRHISTTNGFGLPNRLLYPQEEYTLNFNNVNAQGNITPETIFTTAKVFWQP